MICERCEEREATVHVTMLAGKAVRKVDFCEPCCREAWPALLEKESHLEKEGYDICVEPPTGGSQESETE